MLQMVGKSTVSGSFGLVSWFPSVLLFPPGSSDEDDEGVSAAAFLKKKSEAASGESRKFLKKMEVRARVIMGGDLPPTGHS